MRLSRLRTGELLALVSGIALLGLLGLRWFALSTPEAYVGQHESGFRSLGWFAVLLLLLAAGTAIACAVVTVRRGTEGIAVVLDVITTALGIVATVTVVARLVFQPGLGVEAGNVDVDVLLPAVLGLLAALGIATGGWMAMADERLDTAESHEQARRVVPPPRPAPPPQSASGRGPGDALADPAR